MISDCADESFVRALDILRMNSTEIYNHNNNHDTNSGRPEIGLKVVL